MLPDRLLRCTLGRATNLDPKKQQTTADIVYEGEHEFELFLPAVPVRQGPPPDATEPAEPVNPQTRIVADPDGLTNGFPRRFDRVVDYWPERVEMATTIDDPLVNLIIINPIDATSGSASLFMTQATDVATYDLSKVYQGSCTVQTGATARNMAASIAAK